MGNVASAFDSSSRQPQFFFFLGPSLCIILPTSTIILRDWKFVAQPIAEFPKDESEYVVKAVWGVAPNAIGVN